jgi:hypothetical protein
MSIIDSILKIFRRKPEEFPTETPKEIRVNPLAAASTNLITLSPDMSTLFLIDNNRAISFDLDNKFGVNIGTIDGQLTAATAVPVIFPTDKEDDEEDTPDPDLPTEEDPRGDIQDSPIHRLAQRPRYFKISTLRKQFTIMFNKELGVVSIIGASDIDTSIIGASDIDTSIIGASDIDTSLVRRSTDEPGEEEIPEAFDAQSNKSRCYIFSFRVSKSSINLRKSGGLLIVRY